MLLRVVQHQSWVEELRDEVCCVPDCDKHIYRREHAVTPYSTLEHDNCECNQHIAANHARKGVSPVLIDDYDGGSLTFVAGQRIICEGRQLGFTHMA